MSNDTISLDKTSKQLSKEDFKRIVVEDYKLALISRETSLLGRREVLTGKAKFGIFGDGKEVPQIAMAKFFKNGDFRSGYYRDQTFMMAIGQLSVKSFFAQLYANPNVELEPASGGRSMNGHYASRSLNEKGEWKILKEQKNSSADISPTAGQMPRLLGLAQASKVYRNNNRINKENKFSENGNEVAFGTIGDASTSEGLFWESINAAGVLQIPMVMSVWDDGHGISVPKKFQTTKEDISEVLKGFQKDKNNRNGYEMFRVKAWNYPDLMEVYEKAAHIARSEHIPVFIHVEEVTQPQGHSTSGSHERYKSKERLKWETEYDCIVKMGEWMLDKRLASQEDLEAYKNEAQKYVREQKREAWEDFIKPIKNERDEVLKILEQLASKSSNASFFKKDMEALKNNNEPLRKEIFNLLKKALRLTRNEKELDRSALISWYEKNQELNKNRYSSHLYSQSEQSPLKVKETPLEYDDNAPSVDGRLVLRDNFDYILEKYPECMIFGEDSGKIGDVNQGLEGLQEKYGEIQVSDTGIREATIVGQGIGMAMRGLRPIAEVQYLDYLLYALQIMSDDLATLQYRTKGGQKAPLIVRTRGHRLEGIWHSGSPMGVIINALKGMHICVPRNLTTAAGFYNTLLQGDDPALVIEPLNAYRSKEKMPSNIGKFSIPLGVPEIVRQGSDITIVSYGSTCNIAEEAMKELSSLGISAELIDIRCLMPFDINHMIVESLKKTNRILFLDEDVEAGATAYMMQKVLVEQKGYYFLDSEPKTLSSKNHRPAYGTDGDYFSKPSIDDIVDAVYEIMQEADPEKYVKIY